MQEIGVVFNGSPPEDTITVAEVQAALATVLALALAAIPKRKRKVFMRDFRAAFNLANQGHPHSQHERAGGPDNEGA